MKSKSLLTLSVMFLCASFSVNNVDALNIYHSNIYHPHTMSNHITPNIKDDTPIDDNDHNNDTNTSTTYTIVERYVDNNGTLLETDNISRSASVNSINDINYIKNISGYKYSHYKITDEGNHKIYKTYVYSKIDTSKPKPIPKPRPNPKPKPTPTPESSALDSNTDTNTNYPQPNYDVNNFYSDVPMITSQPEVKKKQSNLPLEYDLNFKQYGQQNVQKPNMPKDDPSFYQKTDTTQNVTNKEEKPKEIAIKEKPKPTPTYTKHTKDLKTRSKERKPSKLLDCLFYCVIISVLVCIYKYIKYKLEIKTGKLKPIRYINKD